MNKKIIALIVAIVIIAVVVVGFWFISSNNKNEPTDNSNSGSNTSENQNSNETLEENTNDNKNSSDSKVAIIYFSATGTTEKIAGYIKDATGGDLIEIVPKDEYTDEDLDWNNKNSRSSKEQDDESVRPEIKNNINTDNYDVIFLGYPIWWGDAPRIILTFLDNHNLDGKTVIPFCTSGGTTISSSVSNLKHRYKNVNFQNGGTLNDGESAVKNWVNGLNY